VTGSRHRQAVRRGYGLAVAGCGLVLLLVAGLEAWRLQPVGETGAGQVLRLAEPPDRPRAAGPPEAPAVPVVPGDPAGVPGRQPPVALRAPAIDLTAPVAGVGVDPETGELALPGADRAGWYRLGPGLEASRGSVVIAGHVDTRDGPGVFFRVAELAPGDRIELTATGGAARSFRVVGREVHRKGELPLERYFDPGGRLRLTLITCTGPFDRRTGSYRDNVVVTAVPD